MSERDELVNLLADAMPGAHHYVRLDLPGVRQRMRETAAGHLADALLAAGWTKDARIAELEAKVAEYESGAEVEWGVRHSDRGLTRFADEFVARMWADNPAETLVSRTVGPWQEVPTTDEQREGQG